MREALRLQGVRESDTRFQSAVDQERYNRHGLAHVQVDLSGDPGSIGIDLTPFPSARNAWLTSFEREGFRVVIADARNTPPKRHKTDGHVELTSDGRTVGLLVSVHYNDHHRQIPYDARLEPLYRTT